MKHSKTLESISTERLILRNWKDEDRPAFHRLNHDEKVMEYFPFRRSRAEAESVMDEIAEKYRTQGFSFGAVELRSIGQCIGICGINPTDLIAAFPDGTVEIGWRFLPEFWGQGYATEAAKGWMEHAFAKLELPELVAFAVHDNVPSHKVMERLNMRPKPEWNFDHPKVPESHRHLIFHTTHLITRQDWLNVTKQKSPPE